MKRTTILTVVMIIGVALFAVGMLASFAGPAAAQEEIDQDNYQEIDQDQYAEQTQTGVVDALDEQGIGVDIGP